MPNIQPVLLTVKCNRKSTSESITTNHRCKMPFVQRVVNPVFIARKTAHSNSNSGKDVTDGHEGTSTSGRRAPPPGSVDNVPGGSSNSHHHSPVEDNELEAVTNRTLSNALRQLASLVLIANDIFMDLNKELRTITERSTTIKVRITALVETVESRDAKLVTVRKYNKTNAHFRWNWRIRDRQEDRT